MNSYTERYVLPKFGVITSAVHSPTSNWIALYGEMGLVGLLIAGLVIFSVVRFFKYYRSIIFPRMSFAMILMVLYVALMGVQDLYWEFTQAMFLAILTLKLCLDYMRKERMENRFSPTADTSE